MSEYSKIITEMIFRHPKSNIQLIILEMIELNEKYVLHNLTENKSTPCYI